MCGRFALFRETKDILKTFLITSAECDVNPSYNIAPTNEVLAVVRREGNTLIKLRWGLIPSWAKDISIGSKLINARLETVEQKPSFRNAFKSRRCLIVADGFYEWQKKGSIKQPWFFTLPSDKPFGFAGLYESWKDPGGTAYRSCTIITTDASTSVSHVHNRMPVIISPDTFEIWLDPQLRDPQTLKNLLLTKHVQELAGHAVSNQVNSPSFNIPSCIEPQLELSTE